MAGVVRKPRHHVFPQEHRPFFEDRGFVGEFDIDNFTIELSQAQHQAIHGGGNWRLGRTSPDEWNSNVMAIYRELEDQKGSQLTRDEMIEAMEVVKEGYGVEGNYVPYSTRIEGVRILE